MAGKLKKQDRKKQDRKEGDLQKFCAEVQRELPAGSLTTRLSHHLDQCPSCKTMAQELNLLRQLALSLPQPPLPRTLKQRKGQMSLVPALSGVLALVLITSSMWYLTRSSRAINSQANSNANVQQVTIHHDPIDLFAALDNAQIVWDRTTVPWHTWLGIPALENMVDLRDTTYGENSADDEDPTVRGGTTPWSEEDQIPTADKLPTEDKLPPEDSLSPLALINDPLGSLATAETIWSPPEILEYL